MSYSHGLSQRELKLALGNLYKRGLPSCLPWRNVDKETVETHTESILEEIKVATKRLKQSDHSYDDILLLQYVNEVWLSEHGAAEEIDTLEICADVVDCEWERVTVALRKWYGDESGRMTRKLRNLRDELVRLFISEGNGPLPTSLSTDYVKEVHRNIMSGLPPSGYAGTYRENVVGPSGTSLTYLPPELIPSRLQDLLDFVNEEAKKVRCLRDIDENKRNERFILLGTLLFAKFLYIHPFRNGNGRVARLLLNTFLAEVCIVPFSLYLEHSSGGRALYLDLLQMTTEEPTETDPILNLAGYILLAVQRQIFNLCWYEMES